MRLKIPVLLVSLLSAMILVSGGYGYWQKDLTIKGNITVVSPETMAEVLPSGQAMPSVNSNLPVMDPGIQPNGQELNQVKQLPEVSGTGTEGAQTTIKSPEEAIDGKTSVNKIVEVPIEKAVQLPEVSGTGTEGAQTTIKSSAEAENSKTSTDVITQAPIDNNQASTQKTEDKK